MPAHPANFWSLKRRYPEAAAFRMQHHLSHATYEQILGTTYGISLPSLDLTTPLTKDWLFRHSNQHVTLLDITARIFGAGGGIGAGLWRNTAGQLGLWRNSAGRLGTWMRNATIGVGPMSAGVDGTVDLASLDPEDPQAITAWMHYHAALHANLDTFFGVHT